MKEKLITTIISDSYIPLGDIMAWIARTADLELLSQLEEVHVEQKGTWFSSGEFVVTSSEEEMVFWLVDSYSYRRSSSRVRASDIDDTTVFIICRPHRIFADKLGVWMDGSLQTVIRKEQIVKPMYNINNARNKPVLKVKGNFRANAFQLQSLDGRLIGSITQVWRGAARALARAYQYEVVFPRDLDTRYKVAVIATCIFIDYTYV